MQITISNIRRVVSQKKEGMLTNYVTGEMDLNIDQYNNLADDFADFLVYKKIVADVKVER